MYRVYCSRLATDAHLHAAHEAAAGSEGGQLVRQLRQCRRRWEAAAVEGLALGRQLLRRFRCLACDGYSNLPQHTPAMRCC